jgi:hypothetical protein
MLMHSAGDATRQLTARAVGIPEARNSTPVGSSHETHTATSAYAGNCYRVFEAFCGLGVPVCGLHGFGGAAPACPTCKASFESHKMSYAKGTRDWSRVKHPPPGSNTNNSPSRSRDARQEACSDCVENFGNGPKSLVFPVFHRDPSRPYHSFRSFWSWPFSPISDRGRSCRVSVPCLSQLAWQIHQVGL